MEPITLTDLWLRGYQFFSIDSKVLMGGNNVLYFHDQEDGNVLYSIEMPNSRQSSLTSLNLSPDGRVLFSATTDGNIYLWGIPK
jgi:WD40 repeat protein